MYPRAALPPAGTEATAALFTRILTDGMLDARVIAGLLAAHAAVRERTADEHVFTVSLAGYPAGSFRLQLFTASGARPAPAHDRHQAVHRQRGDRTPVAGLCGEHSSARSGRKNPGTGPGGDPVPGVYLGGADKYVGLAGAVIVQRYPRAARR